MTDPALKLSGEYDVWRRNELQAALESAELSNAVVIDMSRVTFMDAGAVGLLIGFRRRLRERFPQGKVVLRRVPRIVRRVLAISRAEALFDFTA